MTDARCPEAGLVGYWPLCDDTRDHSPSALATRSCNVVLGQAGPTGRPGTAAAFNGESAFLEVGDHPALHFGRDDFSLCAWVRTEEVDSIGDLLSKFDVARRQGVQLYALTNDGVTSTSTANSRQLSFGGDDGTDPAWTDCGRPGNATLVAALAVADGTLYAGTLEIGAAEHGHLWRHAGGQEWVDLGNPAGTNAVHAVTEHRGALYCATSRYNCDGSVLGPTLNQTPGGHVFRVETDGTWTDCGQPGAEGAVPEETETAGYNSGKADDTCALTVFRGDLYCVSNHRRNVFRHAGGQQWENVGLDHRVITLTTYRGRLHALVNGGPVYRYEGDSDWAYCGAPLGSTQTYGAVVHCGRLYVGTWPQGEVFRYEGGEEWQRIGALGYEREVMGMALYNGKPYLGSLPMANVWRQDGDHFSFVGNLDNSPVILRRVWSMAVHGGLLYAGTLPSGRVWSLRAGTMATWDRPLPGGWRHVAAVRTKGRLRLYVDAREVAVSAALPAAGHDLTTGAPLQIGFGAYDYFRGLLSEVRIYRRALEHTEVGLLATVP
jgi:hypothetical protein